MHLNRRNTLRHAVLASALGASLLASQIAGAQTSPGDYHSTVRCSANTALPL